MITKELEKVAKELFNDIKKKFAEIKKNGGKNPFFNLEIWDCREGGESYMYISFNHKDYGKFNSAWEFGKFFETFRSLLNEQKKKKGYKYLVYEEGEIGNYPCYYKTIEKVGLMDNPCKEYGKLQKYIAKYGNYNLGEFKLYAVNMFGKRGSVDTEVGKRRYLDNDEKRCEYLLNLLRKNKGAKDKMVCKFVGEEVYIDPEEKRESMYYETECYGSKKSYLSIEISTPNGKKKANIEVY